MEWYYQKPISCSVFCKTVLPKDPKNAADACLFYKPGNFIPDIACLYPAKSFIVLVLCFAFSPDLLRIF